MRAEKVEAEKIQKAKNDEVERIRVAKIKADAEAAAHAEHIK